MSKLIMKKGDTVIVKKGRDKGKTGKILKVIPEKNRVIVEKVNFVKEFMRPDRSRNIQGGIMEREAPLSAANVMIFCSDCGQGVRVRKKMLQDGSRIRVCQKCDLSLEKEK
jgi:large subunit ribosomal protein L24